MKIEQAMHLRNVIELSSHIRFYVPGTTSVDKEADNSDTANEVSKLFGEWFGGATQFPAIGTWVSPQSGLVTERVIVVESYCSEEALDSHAEHIINLAQKVKTQLGQEAVAVEIQNKLYLI